MSGFSLHTLQRRLLTSSPTQTPLLQNKLLQHLETNLHTLYTPHTTLLISSDVTNHTKSSTPSLQNYHTTYTNSLHHCHHLLTQRFSLRTVPYTLTSAYPTTKDIDSCHASMTRMGATHVMGVGGGAVMDLAKAVHHDRVATSKNTQLTMVPLTLGGVLASHSPLTMALNVEEEVLMMEYGSTGVQGSTLLDASLLAIPSWTVPDPKHHTIATSTDVAQACLVLCMNAALQYPHLSQEDLERGVRHAMIALSHQHDNPLDMTYILQAIRHVGRVLSHIHQHTPQPQLPMVLTVAAALVPTYFPHGNTISFLASLLPGYRELWKTLPEYPKHQTLTKELDLEPHDKDMEEYGKDPFITKTASLAEGTPDVRELMQLVDIYWDQHCQYDEDCNVEEQMRWMERVLVVSLNR